MTDLTTKLARLLELPEQFTNAREDSAFGFGCKVENSRLSPLHARMIECCALLQEWFDDDFIDGAELLVRTGDALSALRREMGTV
jgi:hypothetical protein